MREAGCTMVRLRIRLFGRSFYEFVNKRRLQRRRCIKKTRRIAFNVGFVFVYTSDIFFIYGRYARVQIFVGDVLSLH